MLFYEKKGDLESFWLTIHDEYPVVAEAVIIQLLPLLSTFICEFGFSTVAFIRKRNCLNFMNVRQHKEISLKLLPQAMKLLLLTFLYFVDAVSSECGENATETLALVYKPVQQGSKRVLGIACQGTIVPGKHKNHTDTVLVSSYCIMEDPPEGYVVSVGSSDPHGDLQSSAQQFRAQRILNFPFEKHPVGILKTPQPIMYSDTVQPMCIASVPLPDEHACIMGVVTKGGLMTLRHVQMLYESDCEPLAEGLSLYLCAKVKEIDAEVAETLGMDPELDIYPFSAPLDFDINGVKAGSLENPLFCLTNEHPTWSVYGFALNAYNVTDPESPILFSDVSSDLTAIKEHSDISYQQWTQAMLKLKDFLYYEDSNTDVGFYRKIVDFVDVTMFKRKVQLKFIMQYTSCPRSQKMSQDDVLYSCPLNEDSEFFRCTAVVSSRYEYDVLMQCKRSSTYCKTNSIYDCSPPMFEEADSMMLRAANQIFYDDLRTGKGKFKRVLAIVGETYEKRSVTMQIKYQETNCTVGSDNMLIVDDVYSDRCPVENLSGTCEVSSECGEEAIETLALVYKPVQQGPKRVLGIACQGTIVPGKHQNHTDTVLVSSYCIMEDPPEGYVVSVGSSDPHGDLQSSAQQFRAQRILNFPFEQHPVGILKTPQPIMYSDTVQPMCIASVPLPDEHACIMGVVTKGGLMTLRHVQMLYEMKEIDAEVAETLGMDPELDIYPFSAPLDFDINGVKAGSLETPLFCLTNEHPTWSVYGFALNAFDVTHPDSPILFSDVPSDLTAIKEHSDISYQEWVSSECGEEAIETLALVYKPVQQGPKRVLGIACQGTIVPGKHQNHTDTVLVSSYCIMEDPPEGYVVSVGSSDPHGDLQSSAQQFRAQRILNFPFEQHPVGILKTPQPIMYSDTVQPMCIASVPLPDEHACIMGVVTKGGLMTLRHVQMLYESDCQELAQGLSSYLCAKVKEIDAEVAETLGMDPELDIYPFSAPLDFDINGVKAGSLETPLFCLTNEHPTWSVYGFALNAFDVTHPDSPILFSDVPSDLTAIKEHSDISYQEWVQRMLSKQG
ncbi:hypothetical protein T12_12664 [Trichinella patagoniensis]|uniref:Peptidase S1 domain-containing protein n=2 Tax=Trichinella TaxID=6333 RepID=A0A0V0ZES5_9BILA|nr:hypothetical protein T12_12664 [Trichinella patagoniensis]